MGEFRHQLERMQRVLSHRGPDDCGTWIKTLHNETRVGLASTRLAILDLSPAGHMPMSTPDRRYTIVYNGEVYNYPDLRRYLETRGYRFRSRTDTETVLYMYQEYGPDCVTRLNGMFAIAIWDDVRQELFLARDHFGVKPLYYAERDGNLAFASEVKALFELPWIVAEPDLQRISEFLTFTWVPDPHTAFRKICKVPPAHYAVLSEGHLTLKRYWDLQFPSSDAIYHRSEQELAEEIRDRFRQSVQAQTLSDVPLGTFLSAGMDSSSITAILAQTIDVPVKTYTITFPDKYRVGEDALDKPEVPRRFASECGCEHHQIVVEPHAAELLPHLIWHMDEPVADPAVIMAYLVCRQAQENVTVLLSGIGGDELFAGYRRHYAHRWAEVCRQLPSAAKLMANNAIRTLPPMRGTRLKGTIRLLKKMARSAGLPSREAFLVNCTYFDIKQQNELFTEDVKDIISDHDRYAEHTWYFERANDADFLNQMLYVDTKTFMPSLNLTYNDKMSMASSLEVRVPFLDHTLAEFVAQAVPPNLKLSGFFRPRTKYIFRNAMKHMLPTEVLHQRKAGFGAPVDYWLTHDLQGMVDDLLSEARVKMRGLFKPDVVRKLLVEHRTGQQDWSMHIWQLLTLEIWMQTFIDRPRTVNSAVAQTGQE